MAFGDRISSFFRSPLFNTALKNKVHVVQLLLVIIMITLTVARIATKPSFIPVTRSDTLGIVMGVKTLVVLAYQLITSHIKSCRRWRSLKAYQILNTLEIAFWLVVVIITLMGVSRYCQGGYCALTWVAILIAVILTFIAIWTAIVSHYVRREEKYGKQASAASKLYPDTSNGV